MTFTPLLSVIAVAVLFVAAAGAGLGILHRMRVFLPTAELLLGSIAVGLGVQATLLLGLSAAGWMHPAALWAATLAPALLGVRRLPAAAGHLPRLLRNNLGDTSPVERIGLLTVFSIVAAMLLIGALGPVQDWDSLMYHVQLPRQFLDEGRLHVPLDGLHVAYLGSLQFLYLPLLAIGAAAGPALLNAALVVGLGVLVVVAGETFLSRGSGILAGIIIWGSSALLLVGMTPRIDISLMYFLLLTQLAIAHALRDDDALPALRYAGLLAGLSFGIKYHALPYLAALAPFAVWAALRTPGLRLRHLRGLGVSTAIAVLCALPWLAKNALLFGAPLYPFFAERVVPPFIAAIQGSTAHPANVSTDIYGALGQAREAISLKGLLLRPAQLTVEGEAAAFTRNWPLWISAFGLLLIQRPGIVVLLLPALAYLSIALGAFTRTNLRYLLPVIPVLALVAAEVIGTVQARLRSVTWFRPAVVIAALMLCVPAFQVVAARTISTLRIRIAVGLERPQALLDGNVQYVIAEWFAEQAPEDARLLMLFDARGYYFRRQTIQDNVLTNWPLLVGTGAVDRCLSGTGITHVMLNRATLGYYQSRGLDPRLLQMDRFDEFARDCLQPLVRVRGVEIYRLR